MAAATCRVANDVLASRSKGSRIRSVPCRPHAARPEHPRLVRRVHPRPAAAARGRAAAVRRGARRAPGAPPRVPRGPEAPGAHRRERAARRAVRHVDARPVDLRHRPRRGRATQRRRPVGPGRAGWPTTSWSGGSPRARSRFPARPGRSATAARCPRTEPPQSPMDSREDRGEHPGRLNPAATARSGRRRPATGCEPARAVDRGKAKLAGAGRAPPLPAPV